LPSLVQYNKLLNPMPDDLLEVHFLLLPILLQWQDQLLNLQNMFHDMDIFLNIYHLL